MTPKTARMLKLGIITFVVSFVVMSGTTFVRAFLARSEENAERRAERRRAREEEEVFYGVPLDKASFLLGGVEGPDDRWALVLATSGDVWVRARGAGAPLRVRTFDPPALTAFVALLESDRIPPGLGDGLDPEVEDLPPRRFAAFGTTKREDHVLWAIPASDDARLAVFVTQLSEPLGWGPDDWARVTGIR